LALLWCMPATAAPITWSEPAPIGSADKTLGLPGRLQGAAHFGPPPDIEVRLANKKVVRFITGGRDSGTNPVADLGHSGGQHAAIFAFQGSGNASFDRVLSGGATEGSGDESGVLTLRRLTPGKRYAVQLFAIDRRGRDGCGGDITDCRRRPVDFGDGQGNFSRRVLEGSGSYVLGSFTADAATQTVIVRGWAINGRGQAWTLNAVVIYEQ
jgi:hypothetical protein